MSPAATSPTWRSTTRSWSTPSRPATPTRQDRRCTSTSPNRYRYTDRRRPHKSSGTRDRASRRMVLNSSTDGGPPPQLEVRRLAKQYPSATGELSVLIDVDLQLRRGQAVAV